MRCDACRCNGAWGGVFVSPAPAYADGYVAPDGNIYYGYKSDANYSKQRIKIEVHYYSSKEDADKDENRDPLGKFVRVKYVANLNSEDNSFDKWAFRPMWWYGVPSGLTNVHNINYSRFEKYTGNGKPVAPSSSQGPNKDSDNVTKHYRDSKDWKSISRFYVEDPSKLTSMNGLKTLLGIDNKGSKGYDSKGGTTADNWSDFYAASKGMQGMFIDWESAGKRFYEMTYVAELTPNAWKNRDEHPLRFAAGVYRFAGNWHIATGQIHRAPKIADSLKNVQYPSLTTVVNANDLNSNEKTSVETAIRKANENTKHFTALLDKIDVAKDGTATLTFHDNTTITMPGKLLVVEDKKDNVKFPPVYPAPMDVVNPKSLSEADQKAIIKGFKDANAGKDFLKKVSTTDSDVYKFDNTKQELTITYTDGSTITVPYSSLVYQGAKISDWAPYVVPDPIEVTDTAKLSEAEQKKVTDAFDTANADLDVYTAAKKDSKTPVTFDDGFKNAIITWADGSQTKVPSWQFLKKKEVTPAPNPQPPTPTPAAEKKTFTVDFSTTTSRVVPNFDPFNASSASEAAKNGVKAFTGALKNLPAKDSDGKTVTITGVDFDFSNGEIIFKAGNDYKDQHYPMSLLFKNGSTGTQNPTQQTPTSKTDTDPNNNKNTYKYFVTKTQINEAKVSDVTAQEVVKALKQFVKDNYTGWTEQELEHVTSNVAVGKNWKAKNGTTNLEPFNKGNGRITTISVSNDNGLTVNGYQYADQEDDNIDASTDGPLFTISADDLYAPNSGSQTPTDNTIENLRKLAKQIRDQRKKAGELTEDAINTLGATDEKINGMDDEKALRDLIKKISDYQKPKPVEYKYNFEKLTLTHDGEPNDDDYKKIVVEQFLKKNYTTTDNTNWSTLENAYSNKTVVLSGNNANTYGLTPVASGTSGLNIYTGNKQTGSVTSVGIDSNGNLVVRGWKADSTVNHAEELIRINKADLYTPKSKEQNPTSSAEELNDLRKQAKELIDRNPNLTPEQKKKFKGDIDNAKDKPAILKILNDAKNQGNTNKTDPNVRQIINKNKNGGDEKKQHELDAAKEAAKKAIEALTHLSNEEKTEFKNKLNGENVKTPADVQKIVDAAKLADELKGAKDEAQKAKFVFLDHGKGGDADSSDSNHAEDAALNSVLGTKPAEDSTLADLAKKLKKDSNATAAEIRDALEAAKRQNGINEQAAKRAATAKLDALEQSLEDAYNKLSETDKNAVSTQYNAAKEAITKAKGEVTTATKPSDLLKAINSVNTSLTAANKAVNDKIDTEHNSNKKNNDHSSDPKALQQEKDKAKKDIDGIPGLTEEEKNDYKKQIDDSTHSGDPEAVVNRAKKNQKIKDALGKLDKDFTHLNNAQKEAFKEILKYTDASDHKNDDGTTYDDIDNVLADAANTDNAMARLDELKKKANDFKNEKDGKYSKLDSTKPAEKKQKDDFDNYLTEATTLTTPDKGDAKGAAEVNTLYDDLLKAMRAINPDAQSAGLKTEALSKEIESDKKLKPSETDPKTPGDSVYTTASQDKKTAFDTALSEAETALQTANDKTKPGAAAMDADAESAAQKAVDDALDKLIKARLALDGVDTTALQNEIGNDGTVNTLDKYKYSTKGKQTAFDKALQDAKDLIDKLTGKKQASTDDHLDTKENKQKALDAALANLKAAEAALDGHAPTPTPTPSVDKSHLQQGINGSGDVKKSDDYNNAPSDKKQAYDHALDHANEVNKDPHATQDQVNQAAEDLKKAEHDLKPAPTPSVDKSGLQKEIGNEPNVKNSDDYNNAPSDKKQAYDHALDHANEVNNNPNATQDQVNQAAEDLKKAEHDLKPTPTPSVDKSHLQQGINGSDDVHNSDDYTNAPSDKKQAYDHALDHANEVNNNPNATQDQVNQAAEDLKNAQKDLHDSATVDKSHLQSEVSDDVAFRARGSYLVADAPHKDAYNAALSEARRVLADPNATQAQVNAALSKLREAKRNILQANGLSGDEYAGDGNTGTGNTGSETGTGNTGIGNTGTGDFGFGNTGTVPGSGVVPGTVPGSGDSGFGSTGTSNTGTTNAGTTNSGVAGSGHEGDTSLGFGVNDNAPTTVDKGELNLQIQGAESDSQSANAGNAGVNSGNAGANNAGANAGNAGANNAANAGNAGANAGNAGANAAANNNAAVTAAVENNPAVKQADAQVAAAQAALDSALAEAKKVAADHNATQAQVDAAKRKLADARKNLADAQAHAAQVRASVRAQVLKSGKVAQLSNTGSAVSALSTFAATIAAAGAALFVSKRRGTSRHCSK